MRKERNKTDKETIVEEEQKEFNAHLAAVAGEAATKLLLVLEMLDELITWLPDEEES